jgi:pimeloyl-ACP methyl ester carboxylesterase
MPAFPDPDAPLFVPRRTALDTGAEVVGWYRALAAWTVPRAHPPRASRARRVVVLPGFGMTDRSTVVLRRYLRARGHDVRKWALGRNHGRLDELLAAAGDRMDAWGPDLALVGWSLGGVLARALACEHPERVTQVVTLGTPVIDGPRYTAAAEGFARANDVDVDTFVDRARDRIERPVPVPTTAIFSRNDRIVAWPATRDPWSSDVDYVEVRTTHAGLGFHPEALVAVAGALVR